MEPIEVFYQFTVFTRLIFMDKTFGERPYIYDKHWHFTYLKMTLFHVLLLSSFHGFVVAYNVINSCHNSVTICFTKIYYSIQIFACDMILFQS